MNRIMDRFDEQLFEPVKDERGVALLICLLVMVIMTVVVFELNYEVQVDAALASNSSLALEAEYAARSGVSGCLALLREDAQIDLALPPESRTDDLTEPWLGEGLPHLWRPTPRATVAARISDEDGKFNINRLVNTKKPTEADPLAVGQLQRLFTDLGILGEADPVVLTNLVCDWVDPDSVTRRGGAENDYYQQLPVPYVCKNSRLDSIEELALVRRFTQEMISGRRMMTESGMSLVALADPAQSEDEIVPGLAELLTVCGGAEGRININTAPEPVIRAVFYKNPAVAENIISQRSVAPFAGLKDLKQRVPQKFGTGINVSFTSQHFSILSEGNVHGMRVRIETSVRRRITNQGVMFETLAWKVTT